LNLGGFLTPLRWTSPFLLVALPLTVATFSCIPVWGLLRSLQDSGTQPSTKPQPVAFSHKLHVHLGLTCKGCHEMPSPGRDMTYPVVSKCMQCHAVIMTDNPAVQKLAKYFKEEKPVPWVQVYKVPDFVFFSHSIHNKRAEIVCETCHGPVAERDVITKEKSTSMGACMDCHVERRAPTGCGTCHNR